MFPLGNERSLHQQHSYGEALDCDVTNPMFWPEESCLLFAHGPDRNRRVLKKIFLKNRMESAEKMWDKFQEASGSTVSTKTILKAWKLNASPVHKHFFIKSMNKMHHTGAHADRYN
ncbi:hypothetical protein AVEN_56198-1 [Araneus ventricosus]|uniref:Uncharacterized protein n=1 Tax=Araneus ventricosus TaxID=182803 RepID=A0A4Y2P125_ARAVE|nr:hypothetical protein AVEN_56198-1 [Araneus ventricosus]